MSAALKFRAEEGVENVGCKAGAGNSRAYAKHVCIVVASRHSCREGVAAYRRANAVILVRAHRHTDARTADKNTEGGVKLALNLLAYRRGEDRVVAGRVGVCAAVLNLVATADKVALELLLEEVACAVRAYLDLSHNISP